MRTYSKHNFCVDIMSVHKEVTGSCLICVVHFPNGEKTRFLVDCGIFQEPQYIAENDVLKFEPSNFQFTLLTHNHADHFGRLPLLVHKGFEGKIYTTTGTSILLPPALNNTFAIDYNLRKTLGIKPIITSNDVKFTLDKITAYNYKERFKAYENVNITFFKNGHLPGAAVILVEIYYPGYDSINLIFTGDYNDKNSFFEVPGLPERVANLPSVTVIQECTYGENKRKDSSNNNEFESNIANAISNKAAVLIPALSQGRTQDVLLSIKRMQEQKIISSSIPVFLDGNLSKTYTKMWLEKDIGIRESMRDFLPTNFQYSDKVLRKTILKSDKPSIVVTSSGMGTHGPAQSYIPNYLMRKNALIQFTSYQAEGTVGRMIKDSDEKAPLLLYGMIIPPRQAQVEFTRKFSSHANQDGLYKFLQQFSNLKTVLLNHGNFAAQKDYGEKLIESMPRVKIGILGETVFRINSTGVVKTIAAKF